MRYLIVYQHRMVGSRSRDTWLYINIGWLAIDIHTWLLHVTTGRMSGELRMIKYGCITGSYRAAMGNESLLQIKCHQQQSFTFVPQHKLCQNLWVLCLHFVCNIRRWATDVYTACLCCCRSSNCHIPICHSCLFHWWSTSCSWMRTRPYL